MKKLEGKFTKVAEILDCEGLPTGYYEIRVKVPEDQIDSLREDFEHGEDVRIISKDDVAEIDEANEDGALEIESIVEETLDVIEEVDGYLNVLKYIEGEKKDKAYITLTLFRKHLNSTFTALINLLKIGIIGDNDLNEAYDLLEDIQKTLDKIVDNI